MKSTGRASGGAEEWNGSDKWMIVQDVVDDFKAYVESRWKICLNDIVKRIP